MVEGVGIVFLRESGIMEHINTISENWNMLAKRYGIWSYRM